MDNRTCLGGKGNPEFFFLIDTLPDKDRLYAVMAYNTAATLMHMKPANLLSFTNSGYNLLSSWRRYGEEICLQLGLRAMELCTKPGSAVVLFYTPHALEEAVRGVEESAFLAEAGYQAAAPLSQHLGRLQARFQTTCPHEIGIFLGIPVQDIQGFIQHGGQNCKLCRYWKVYHDTSRAEELFSAFDHARHHIESYLIQRFSSSLKKESAQQNTYLVNQSGGMIQDDRYAQKS